MLRSICSEESSSRSATGNTPLSRPSAKPRLPPMASPISARWVLIQTWCSSAPLTQRVPERHAPWRWAPAGRAPRAARLAPPASQTSSRTTGSEPGRQAVETPVQRRPHDARPRLRATGIDLVGDDLAERAGVAHRAGASRPVRRLQRQQREHQLGEAVAFLQMRVAGEDEGVDARAPCTPASARPPSRGRRPAPCRRRRAPGPTPAHRLGLISSLSRRPPCSRLMRCWPTESMRANTAWALAMLASSTWRDQPVGRGPGLGRGLAHDDVQADAEAQLAAARGRGRALACSIFCATSAGGSPQVR